MLLFNQKLKKIQNIIGSDLEITALHRGSVFLFGSYSFCVSMGRRLPRELDGLSADWGNSQYYFCVRLVEKSLSSLARLKLLGSFVR